MARRKAILQSDFPYHITARCINKEWFSLPMPFVWQIMEDELYLTHAFYDLKIHTFVLMPNHFHLIASTPQANISECMRYFMTRTSHRLTEAGNRINATYAGRHFKCVLQTNSYYLNAYKYLYRNPVEAGLCDKVEDYPYSSLPGLLGYQKTMIPLLDDTILCESPESTLQWLNDKPPPEKTDAVWVYAKELYLVKIESGRHRKMSRSDGGRILVFLA